MMFNDVKFMLVCSKISNVFFKFDRRLCCRFFKCAVVREININMFLFELIQQKKLGIDTKKINQ